MKAGICVAGISSITSSRYYSLINWDKIQDEIQANYLPRFPEGVGGGAKIATIFFPLSYFALYSTFWTSLGIASLHLRDFLFRKLSRWNVLL